MRSLENESKPACSFSEAGRALPFALIFPGGGFAYVGSLHEGFPLADALSRKGCNAFVLHYRTGGPTASFGGGRVPRPAAIVMAYTGHDRYTVNDPPTFAVVSQDDPIASPSVMARRSPRWTRQA